MKKGVLTLIMVALSGMIFLTVGALTAADVPGDIKINNEGYAKDKKGPVPFSHKAHIEKHGVLCIECHHVYKDGKNVWKEGDPVQKCGECHNPLKREGNVHKLQNAFHKNCKECHKAKNAGPFKKCNDCHEKK